MSVKNFFFLALTIFFVLNITAHSLFPTRTVRLACDAEWAIIGAGPAGIIILGVLLDLGTDPKSIIWVDPEFNVGRLGKYYSTVPGNAKTKQFIEFINSCNSFQACNSTAVDKLYTLDAEIEYELKVIVEPLQDITNHLCNTVNIKKDYLSSLTFTNDVWCVGTSGGCFTAAHVILATGSHPKKLDYPCKNEISLDIALDKNVLQCNVDCQDTVAVVGSGQSAVLLLKYLSELSVGRVINFYRNPIDFDNPESGLKGSTARWARDVLLKTPPVNLVRIFNSCESLKAWLPICTKIVYAVGYERNELPPIANASGINFNDPNGVIGPRLFGIGIAFPEKYEDEQGKIISRIGLMSFMEYAQEILPYWMQTKKSLSLFTQFEDLFAIEIL